MASSLSSGTSNNTTTVAVKKVPPDRNLTVMVDGKILNKFESFNISHSLDVVPMSFSLVYGLDNGEKDDALSIKNIKSLISGSETLDNSQFIGLLGVGQKIEIYLEQQHVFTGYIESVNESFSYGDHKLYIDGRSLVSVIIDSTTNKPSGQVPTTISNLKDVADYMFGDFGIITKDKTAGDTKYSMANLLQIDLTTKPFDYVSTLAQYEGKLLYDNELGQMVIDDVAKDKSSSSSSVSTGSIRPVDCLTNDISSFESISTHKTILGRYRNYTAIIDLFGGPPGTTEILIDRPTAQDHSPEELPPGKNLTIVSTAAYPTDGSTNGLMEFQKNLMQYTANVNWGRSQTVSGTVTGYINPITKKIWRVNSYVKFKMDKPSLEGGFVVQSVNFYIDEYGGRKTDLVFVPPEALQVAPISIAPLIPMAHTANNSEDSTNSATTPVQKPQKVDPPANAKPNTTT